MLNKYQLVMDIEKRKNKPNTVLNKNLTCPFCESQVPKIIEDGLMIDEKETMYWAKNKFPMLKETYQTLIVESKQCGEDFTTYSEDYAKEVFAFIFTSMDRLKHSGTFKEVLYIKNHGLFSGSSIAHSHSQIIGLTNLTYDYKEIEDSIEGPVIFKDDQVTVTISEIPRSELYEFNVIWNKGEPTQAYVKWIQTLIRYISQVKNYDSYNLLLHETPEQNMMKVIPKRTNSVLYLGYGIRQVPNDLMDMAKDILAFSKKQHLDSELVIS